MKKKFTFLLIFLSLILCFNMLYGCSSKYAQYFDLSDETIIFDVADFPGIKVNNICLDRLEIYLKKAKIYKKLTVKDFKLKNITYIEYYKFEPDETKINDIQYMENFRQKIGITITDIANIEELFSMIKEIEKLDFVKEVYVIMVVDL